MTKKGGTSKAAAQHRRLLFIEAYISNGGNATQAAVAAGYSARTAGQQGYDLLKRPDVSDAIAHRRAELQAECKLDTETVMRSLTQVLLFDPRNLFHADGTLKAVHELDDDTAMALAGVDKRIVAGPDGRLTITKLKWLDKNTAREQALKVLGLYKPQDTQQASAPEFDMTVLPSERVREAFERALREHGDGNLA
jgi:phage terminase small subunit